jgi:hypothetical protein
LLRLLLDAHIPGQVARQLREQGHDVEHLSAWELGQYRTRPDHEIIAAALGEHRILVTFDVRSIPALIRGLLESGAHHSGVIFVDYRTIRPDDVGGLVLALGTLLETDSDSQWEDRSEFLQRTSRPT